MNPWTRCCALAAFLLAASTAQAEPKHFAFTGTIDGFSDSLGFLPPLGINGGDTISGRFSYNTDDVLTTQTPTKATGAISGKLTLTINTGTDTYTAYVDDVLLVTKTNDDALTDDYLEIGTDQGIYDPEIAGTYTPNPGQLMRVWFYDASGAAFTDITTLPDSLNLADTPGAFSMQANLGTAETQAGMYQFSGTLNTLLVSSELTFENGFEPE